MSNLISRGPMPRYRAPEFLHPDLDEPSADRGSGLGTDARGGVATVDEERSVRQAVLLLLSTAPGERVMRPEYGCDLRKLIFAPNDATTAGLAIFYVRRALGRWEPRVEVVSLDARASDAAPGRLDIVLIYRLRAGRRPQRLDFSLDLLGPTA